MCGFENTTYPGESLVSVIKISAVKGAASVFELRIRMESREKAIICTQAVYQAIRDFQVKNMKPYVESTKYLLLKYQNRLQYTQNLIDQANKNSSLLPTAIYLAYNEEISSLSEKIFKLNSIVALADVHQINLVAPIYVSHAPVYPKKKIILVVALLVGLFLGVLYALLFKVWYFYKARYFEMRNKCE
jgi:hypothetical protein